MKRPLLYVTAAAALAAIVAASGCCCPIAGVLEQTSDSQGTAGERGETGGAPSLDTFLDADAKTGEYSTHTEWYGGETYDQTGEFWVDGRLFRYDIYENGELVRSVMSPDGQTAYFVHHAEQECEPAVASVDYYLRRYFRPEGAGVEDGIDEDTGATRVVYSVKSTDDMAGAANAWYSEDVTYLVKDDVVIGVITRGAVPEDDGSIEGLDVNREIWSNVKAGVKIPSDTFELPYPVKNAE